MPRQQFQYWSDWVISPNFPGGFWAFRRPMLQVSLTNGQKRLSAYGMLDTGADHCVFPESFMAPLGIDPLSAPAESTTGVGAISVTRFHTVKIEIAGLLELSVYAGFTDGLESWGIGLLGHRGFIDQFKLTLEPGFFEIETPQ